MIEVLLIDGTELVVENQTAFEIIDVSEPTDIIEAQAQGPIGPQGPTGLSGSSISSYPAAVAVGGHVAVVLDSDGKVIPADAATTAHRAVAGITLGAAVQDAAVEVTAAGLIEHIGWTFTPGAPVFLGLAGALTQTLPPSAVFSKVLGMAVTPTRISVDFQPAIFI